MGTAELLALLGVFLGGAIPWLEAIVVIPPAIVAGLPPVPTVLAGVTGNLATVALAAWFGERLRHWWLTRRRRAAATPSADANTAAPGCTAPGNAAAEDTTAADTAAADTAPAPDNGSDGATPPGAPREEHNSDTAGQQGEPARSKRWVRLERIMHRWGLPALAALGPLGFGTQVSALVAVGFGVRARIAFAWIGLATVAWSIVAALAAVTGMSIIGVGG